jgi:pimeloyl-ACP methyl ester carboxylesterase
MFLRALALPLGLLMIGNGIANVFVPQLPPADYARRSASRLVLRPAEFMANAQDIAVLKPFVTAQVPRYRAIAAPTVIISGDRDSVVSVDLHARAAAALIPGAKLVLLEGVGHMPQHAAAEAIIEAINEMEGRIANGE